MDPHQRSNPTVCPYRQARTEFDGHYLYDELCQRLYQHLASADPGRPGRAPASVDGRTVAGLTPS